MNEKDDMEREAAEYFKRHTGMSHPPESQLRAEVELMVGFASTRLAAAEQRDWVPVDMLLYCPVCFEQHVDEANSYLCEDCGHNEYCHSQCTGGEFSPLCRGGGGVCESSCKKFNPWLNPPHKSHRCNSCNHVWRPADVPTNGVRTLNSKGERDGSPRPVAFANGKDFNDAVAIARPAPTMRVREGGHEQGGEG